MLWCAFRRCKLQRTTRGVHVPTKQESKQAIKPDDVSLCVSCLGAPCEHRAQPRCCPDADADPFELKRLAALVQSLFHSCEAAVCAMLFKHETKSGLLERACRPIPRELPVTTATESCADMFKAYERVQIVAEPARVKSERNKRWSSDNHEVAVPGVQADSGPTVWALQAHKASALTMLSPASAELMHAHEQASLVFSTNLNPQLTRLLAATSAFSACVLAQSAPATPCCAVRACSSLQCASMR